MANLALVRPVGHEHLGYGTFGYNLAKGLRELGINLWENADITALSPPADHSSVIYTSVPGWCPGRFEDQHITLFSMWEGSRLPESFADRLHNYNLICVPNEQNLAQFKEFNPNVVKVHLGYDSGIWSYQPRTEGDTFRILFCGAGAVEKTRKGSDVAIEAFKEAFPSWQKMSPSPRLVIKCLDCPPADTPEFVELHVGQWPVTQLRDLYMSCHGAIIPSRGEGWGYFPMQAVASGLPTILSDIPGHSEFSHLPGFLTVPTEPVPAMEFIYGDAGLWNEPSIPSTVEHLQRLYGDYTTLSGEARTGSEVLSLFWDHKAMARDLLKVVPLSEYVNPRRRKFQKFTELEFPLTVNRELQKNECSIAGTRYHLKPDHEYWVSANVCQVLERSGYRANLGDTRYRPPVV